MREFIDSIDWDKLRTGKALEIGGGICWGSAIAKSKSPLLQVVATDIAVSSLIKAREISKVFNVQIDQFIATDIQSSPFPDDCFDFIFSFAVLHHLPDLKKAVSEIHRILKPGGIYIALGETMMSSVFKFLFTSYVARTARKNEKEYTIRERVCKKKEWIAPFQAANFSEVNINICKNPRYKYFSSVIFLYYLFLKFVPNFLIPPFLGSEIHIIAKK